MDIIITGSVGIGKTTVCKKLLELARKDGYTCGGILTPKAIDGNNVKGIEAIDIQTGERECLAALEDIYDGPRIGRYFFNPEGISFGAKAIEKGASADIFIVDEIGYLELQGGGFACAIAKVRAKKMANSILVIRKELVLDFQAQLDNGLPIFEATLENRSDLPQRIYSYLVTSLPEASPKAKAKP